MPADCLARSPAAHIGAPQLQPDAIDIHEHEAGGIPDFVGEVAIAFGAAFVEGDIRAGSGHGRQSEAGRVRSKSLDDFQGIEHVALGLRHFLALGVAHERVNVDLAEGDAVVFFVGSRPLAFFDQRDPVRGRA